jgi:hypothetical protein
MGVIMPANVTSDPEGEVFITVEDDDDGGAFLELRVVETETGEELVDLVLTDNEVIDAFFTMVKDAQAAYNNLLSR